MSLFATFKKWGEAQAIALEARDVWNRGFEWYGHALNNAMALSQQGLQAFRPIQLCSTKKPTFKDTGHMSLYRALGRDKYAVHWTELVQHGSIEKIIALNNHVPWAQIESSSFWQQAAHRLNNVAHPESGWMAVLEQACYNGNVHPFQYCQPSIVANYASKMRAAKHFHSRVVTTIDEGVLVAKMVHPYVATWFVEQSLWTTQDLTAQVDSDSCPMHGSRVMGFDEGVTCEMHYLTKTCEIVLRDYGLNMEQKVRFMGQTLLSLHRSFWEPLLHCLAPHLEGINLGILKAACGVVSVEENTQDVALLKTVQAASLIGQYSSGDMFVPAFNCGASLQIAQECSQADAGLLLVLDLSPAANRFELYCRAVSVMNAQRGLVKEAEAFALPNLDATP